MLTLLFNEIYMNLNNKRKYPFVEKEELEHTLENYIMKVMGYRVRNEYVRCMEAGIPQAFLYYGAVRRWINNLIQNFDYSKSRTLIEAIEEYGSNFYLDIAKYPNVDRLITGIKRLYSDIENDPSIIIDHKDKMYKISMTGRNNEGTPVLVINNIEHLEKILSSYIDSVRETDNRYKNVFREETDERCDRHIEDLLRWTVINVSNTDALDLERFFCKYKSFINDETFSMYRHNVTEIGEILNDRLFVMEKLSSCSYETPFYLSYMLCNRRVELPNVRMGIEKNGDKKIAHILSIQSTQENVNRLEDPKVNKEIREQLPKSHYFREFNPSHLFSLALTLGLLNGAGIDEVVAYEYLPMRYQRFVIEQNKNEEELHEYQHRLTNKYINTFFRLLEFTEDIDIISYPENCNNLKFKLRKDISFNNELLNKAYQIGYNQSKSLNEESMSLSLINKSN